MRSKLLITHTNTHRKGDFEKIIVFIFLIVVGVTIMGFAALDFIHFKVDVQTSGQEEYNRFALTEKILNAPGCTISRGTFLKSKLLSQDPETCQFIDCPIDTTIDWAYSALSNDFELPICEVTTSSDQTVKYKFKISEAIPILVYDKASGVYSSAYLLIYGPEGIYSSSYSSGRSAPGTLEVSEKEKYKSKINVDYMYDFDCDAPQGLEPRAKCVIDQVIGSIEANTGGRCNPCELKSEVYAGTDKKETETVKEDVGGIWSTWEKWTADNFVSTVVWAGEDTNIGIKWNYVTGKTGSGYFTRNFRKPYLKIIYRVICPPGMVAEQIDDKYQCKGLEPAEEEKSEVPEDA